MHSSKSMKRGVALLMPILAIAAAFALFLGGSGTTVGPQDASAVTSDVTGVYNVLVTLPPAFNSETFHCILAQHHDAGVTDAVNGKVVCYADTPSLASAPDPACPPATAGNDCGGSAVPTKADGVAGAPPPPGYGTGTPNTVNGLYTKGTDTVTADVCFPDTGSLLGPHLIARNTINATTDTGTVDLLTHETFANCNAGTPVGAKPFLGLTLTIALVQKANGADQDGDGCTDADELDINVLTGATGVRPKGCGDDPYNPFDSDGNLNSVATILVTATQEDIVIAGGENGAGSPADCYDNIDNDGDGGIDAGVSIANIPPDPDGCLRVPGAYFSCQASVDHNKGTGALRARVQCYTDSTSSEVNNADRPGVFGDGSSGTPPPLPFADIDDPIQDGDATPEMTQLNGTVTGNTASLKGCFEGVDNILGPNVWASATFDIHTGQGTVSIWPLRADCSDADPDNDKTTDPPLFPNVLLEIAEQQPRDNANSTNDYDNDQDGCTDTNELSDDQTKGGMRDPYNVYDFFDPDGNRSVAFPDFLQVLQHFNTNDTQVGAVPVETNPYSAAAVTGAGVYSPRYDRGGQLTGGNGWNEDYPNGAIGFPDFLSLLRQFGHTCSLHISPFK